MIGSIQSIKWDKETFCGHYGEWNIGKMFLDLSKTPMRSLSKHDNAKLFHRNENSRFDSNEIKRHKTNKIAI